MMNFDLVNSKPSVEEIITVKVDEHICLMEFRRYGDADDPFPLYDLDITFDGGSIKLERPRWRAQALKPSRQSLNVAKLLRMIRAIFTALDEWGQRHPQTFVTTYEPGLAALIHILYRQGIIGSNRFEQWLLFYNKEGQRTLFVGMLNLIEDKLAVNDLWRVAKDSGFYLGRYYSPVDMFLDALKLPRNDDIQPLS